MSVGRGKIAGMVANFDRPEVPGPYTLDDLGTDLHDVTFTVVDLETTGTHTSAGDITEIGAIKSRGGEVLGEFQTLVKPSRSVISPFVQRLTGITNSMVANAPELATVLPEFFEFAHGSVLVAHNAGFDIGFLKESCTRVDFPWPNYAVLDTVKLARMTVSSTEVRNHKLATLAAFFNAPHSPTHRALDDARATHHVLQCMFERFGSAGVTTLEELQNLKPKGWVARQAKRHLATAVPHAPGVYMFLDGANRVLYVGTSHDMRTRVNSYFNLSESRSRMTEMTQAAQEVRCIVCPTNLEARVRELRLIDAYQPPYNRKSKRADRATWLGLTNEPFPRLSVVRTRPKEANAPVLGPFNSHRSATLAKDACERAFDLKRCTAKVSARSFSPCAAGEMGKCGGPCSGTCDPADYAAAIAPVIELFAGNAHAFTSRMFDVMRQLGAAQRYEDAATLRDATQLILRTCARSESQVALSRAGVVGAVQRVENGWVVVVLHRGLLAASETVPVGADPVAACRTLAQHAARFPESHAGLSEERALLTHWMSQEGVHLIHTEQPLHHPVSGYQSVLARSGLAAGV